MMKNNIGMIMLIIIVFMTSAIACAQQERPQGPPQLPNDEQIKEMITELSDELSLTDEQEVEISDLYFDHFDKAAELQENNKGKRGEGREEMEKLRSDFDAAVNEVLTKDQQKLFKNFQKKQQAQRGKERKPGNKPQ